MKDWRRWAGSAALAWGVFSLSRPTLGDPQPAPAEAESRRAREARGELVLRVEGPFSDAGLAALERVIRSQLGERAAGVRLVRTDEPLLSWTRRTRQQRSALVIAILDARKPESWELYVVDAARGRAARRTLPGGVETDAAALEAVGVILAAAVAAVREGLEVASASVEDVVAAAEPPEKPRVPAAPPPQPKEVRGRPARWLLGAGLTVTRVADELGAGAFAGAGVHLDPRWSLHLDAALFLPVAIESDLGSFDLQRGSVESRVSWSAPAGPFTLVPSLGPVLEIVRRRNTEPAALVSGGDDSTRARFGAAARLALAHPLSGSLAVWIDANASYFPQRLRFVANAPRPRTVVELSSFEFGASIGIAWNLMPDI